MNITKNKDNLRDKVKRIVYESVRRVAQNEYERFKLHCIEFWQDVFCMDNFDIIKLMELV
jgi:hypothetical protein